MTPDRYLKSYRPNYHRRSVDSLADFLEAVAAGEDLWSEGVRSYVTFPSMNGHADYQALKALGWSAGADYGSYGSENIFVYNPHPKKTDDS